MNAHSPSNQTCIYCDAGLPKVKADMHFDAALNASLPCPQYEDEHVAFFRQVCELQRKVHISAPHMHGVLDAYDLLQRRLAEANTAVERLTLERDRAVAAVAREGRHARRVEISCLTAELGETHARVWELQERVRKEIERAVDEVRLRADMARIAAIAADTSMAHEDRVYAISDVSRSSLADSESPKRDTEAANTEVLRLRAAMRGLMPDGWDDGTMDHMPGIKAARLALAGVTVETQGTPCDSVRDNRVRPEDETSACLTEQQKEANVPFKVTDEMVARFLGWRLPDDFDPDCGISFKKLNHPTSWPVGTNLLNAAQARAMLEYVLGPADNSEAGR